MNQIGCRIWSLSILTVLALTIYNVLLTMRFIHGPECSMPPELPIEPPRTSPLPPAPCVSNLSHSQHPQTFKHLDLRLGRWDAKRMLKMFDFAIVGDQYASLGDKFSVCLATQSSLEKLFSLVQVSHHWSGSISAAVFAAGEDEYNLLMLYIAYLRRCYQVVKDRVSFHLAYPTDRPPRSITIDLSQVANMDCLKPETTLHQILKRRSPGTSKWRVKNPYPQNHLRNLARKNCQTSHVFLTDVDIIPSIGLCEGLQGFLKTVTCEGKCAFVIPTYELDERVKFPGNKSELVRLANKGLARPFHHKVFIYNQYATNFSRWQSSVTDGPEVHISHRVTNFEFLYEPFYVAPDTVPPHDERFLGYGYTRNTQVYEMFVADYEFHVLSPVFTCHWGLQHKRSRPPWRERQNSANRRYFELFKREVFARYRKDPLHMLHPIKDGKRQK